MDEYRLLKKGIFESVNKFEGRINRVCRNEKYQAISLSGGYQQGLIVLLEKIREH
ncbi:MAG: hypothetical protein ACOC31_03695 [Bacteroidota bacterium]